mmetsp:Transcript_29645/g.58652  ORF Transcript_29645/g.58652 Transcript_29645/m.58652 type:complete len:217 (-) Transcript_29645:4055-4705(-)
MNEESHLSTSMNSVRVQSDRPRALAVIADKVLFIDFGNDSFKAIALGEEAALREDALLCDPEMRRITDCSEILLRHPKEAAPSLLLRSRLMLILLAAYSNLWARFSLKFRGLGSIFEHAKRLETESDLTVDQARLQRVVRSFVLVNTAFSLHKDPKDCLPRSLALRQLLTTLGIASRMKIGARLAPFSSHAWVEVNNKPILDRIEDISDYRVLLAI